jgi:hypothetical protein
MYCFFDPAPTLAGEGLFGEVSGSNPRTQRRRTRTLYATRGDAKGLFRKWRGKHGKFTENLHQKAAMPFRSIQHATQQALCFHPVGLVGAVGIEIASHHF